MTEIQKPVRAKTRKYPKLVKTDDGEYRADYPEDFRIQDLMGMQTHDAAHGIYETALCALGESADKFSGLVSAMFAEIEPQDAIKAMLVAQKKHRAKAQQVVHVERVNVESGAQAVVGNVSHGGRAEYEK